MTMTITHSLPMILAEVEVVAVERLSPTYVRVELGSPVLADFGVDGPLYDQRIMLVFPNDAGTPIRIGEVARAEEREGLSSISREDQQYVRIVSYEFRGPPKLAERTHKAFMASISVPAGYWVGDDEFAWGADDSGKGLWLVFGIGVVLVILSVAMVFDSVWASAMVFLSLPLALAGVIAAF